MPTKCPLCRSGFDSVDHLIRICPFTLQVLQVLGLSFSTSILRMDFKQWLVQMFTVLDDKGRKLLSLGYWAIWHSRNNLIHNGVKQSVNDLVGFIKGYLAEIEGVEFLKAPKTYLALMN